MAQLLQTSISGSSELTGSLIISGSQPVQLPLVNSGSGEIDFGTGYQFWFDSGDNYVKYHVKGSHQTGAWGTGGSMTTPRRQHAGFGQSYDATVAAGGFQNSSVACTEEYNGSTWTTSGALNVSRYSLSGAGSQNSGLAFGGTPALTCTEEYDGSSWTTGGTLISARRFIMGNMGITQDAVLGAGGQTPTVVTCTEEYNGTSWSSGGNLITARFYGMGAGSQNSGLVFGGITPSTVACTEEYNGSSFSAGGAMIAARSKGGGSGTCQDNVIAANGRDASTNVQSTELYDGTSWSTAADSGTAFSETAGGGNGFSISIFGGEPGSGPGSTNTATLEYVRPYVPPFSCYLPGVWSAGGTLITAGYGARGGTQNAAFQVMTSPITTCHENYDGTSWSSKTAMPSAADRSGAGAGLNTDAYIIFGGCVSPTCTREWDGASWSVGGDLITAAFYAGSTGANDAALRLGGSVSPAYRTCVENYNGTSWSTLTGMPHGVGGMATAGTENDALVSGGVPTISTVASWNGASWTTETSLITGRQWPGGSGNTSNAALTFGGENPVAPYPSTVTEEWNGSVWSSAPNLSAARAFGYAGGRAGSQQSALAIGGTYNTAATEEYNKTFICTGTYQCYLSSTWSVGGAMIQSRSCQTTFGASQNAAAVVGGSTPGPIMRLTEEYDGTSWTAGGNLPSFHCANRKGSNGSLDAGLAYGGCQPPSTINKAAEYNGTSWSAVNTLNKGDGKIFAGAGTQNSTIVAGGANPAGFAQSWAQEYDGSTWSGGGNLITAILGGMASTSGTQNDSIVTGGKGGNCTCTQHYNGTSWSTGGALSTARYGGASFGITNSTLVLGGQPSQTCTEEYNGSTWSTQAAGPSSGLFANGGAGGSVNSGMVTNGSCALEYSGELTYSNLTCCTRCLDATCTQI